MNLKSVMLFNEKMNVLDDKNFIIHIKKNEDFFENYISNFINFITKKHSKKEKIFTYFILFLCLFIFLSKQINLKFYFKSIFDDKVNTTDSSRGIRVEDGLGCETKDDMQKIKINCKIASNIEEVKINNLYECIKEIELNRTQEIQTNTINPNSDIRENNIKYKLDDKTEKNDIEIRSCNNFIEINENDTEFVTDYDGIYKIYKIKKISFYQYIFKPLKKFRNDKNLKESVEKMIEIYKNGVYVPLNWNNTVILNEIGNLWLGTIPIPKSCEEQKEIKIN